MSDKKDRHQAPVKTEINVSGGFKVEGQMTNQGADKAADQVADGIQSFLKRVGAGLGWLALLWGFSKLLSTIAPNGLF